METAKSKKKKGYKALWMTIALWIIGVMVGMDIGGAVAAEKQKQQERISWQDVENRRKSLERPCPIEGLDNQKAQLWATVLFPENAETINATGQEILRKTAIMQHQCNKRLLLIGHASKKESIEKNEKIPTSMTLLGMKRAVAVMEVLQQQGVPRAMHGLLSCGIYFPRYEEKNPKSSKGNQRVDIVLYDVADNWLLSLCLGGSIPTKEK